MCEKLQCLNLVSDQAKHVITLKEEQTKVVKMWFGHFMLNYTQYLTQRSCNTGENSIFIETLLAELFTQTLLALITLCRLLIIGQNLERNLTVKTKGRNYC